MTRGTAVLLTNFKSVTSCEFNGDMFIEPDSNGALLLECLDQVKTVRQFKRAIEKFNNDCFGYNDVPIHLIIKKLRDIKFKESTYFKYWFSDYLTFLNISWFKIKITDMDGKIFYLLPGELAVFFFGKFYLSYNYQAQAYAEIPIRTIKPIPAE
ncbi:hypothetical protein KKA66_02055 [Patescibacteria group bacterium]|nr:hypothetical protein [Patescibacteria group bacterium]